MTDYGYGLIYINGEHNNVFRVDSDGVEIGGVRVVPRNGKPFRKYLAGMTFHDVIDYGKCWAEFWKLDDGNDYCAMWFPNHGDALEFVDTDHRPNSSHI